MQDDDEGLDKVTYDQIRNDVSMQRSTSSSQENYQIEEQ